MVRFSDVIIWIVDYNTIIDIFYSIFTLQHFYIDTQHK